MAWFGGLNGDDFDPYYESDRCIKGEDYAPSSKRCKFCGMVGLYWHHTKDGWKLSQQITQYIPHKCSFKLLKKET